MIVYRICLWLKRFCQVLKGAAGVTLCQNEAEVKFNVHWNFYFCLILADGHNNCSFQRLIIAASSAFNDMLPAPRLPLKEPQYLYFCHFRFYARDMGTNGNTSQAMSAIYSRNSIIIFYFVYIMILFGIWDNFLGWHRKLLETCHACCEISFWLPYF